MPAQSKAQQQAASIALHAPKSELRGASKQMANSMDKSQLRNFADTKRTGLPKKVLVGMNNQGMTNSSGYPTPKACTRMEDLGATVVNNLLEEDDEQAEVNSAQNVLNALTRLQASLTNPHPGATA